VVAHELQLEEIIDQGAVDRLGVLPVEIGDRLHHGKLGGGESTLAAATLSKKNVWTNVNPAGDAYLEDPASTCADWSSADKLKSARAGINAVAPGDAAALAEWRANKHWLSAVSLSCSAPYRIYCIEAS